MITASGLRKNIYRLLDRILETGEPLEIERKGALLKIIPQKKKNKLDSLKKRKIMNCDPEKLVHIDWSSEWKM
jgi:antitoxin (DNA-binding transcriptional repressor) of toxin-antitoxin stability system